MKIEIEIGLFQFSPNNLNEIIKNQTVTQKLLSEVEHLLVERNIYHFTF